MSEKVSWLKEKESTSLAIRRLEETLKLNLSDGRLLTEMHMDLHERFEKLGNQRLREVLFKDSAGVTAKVLDIVWDAAIPKLIGRQLCQVMTKGNTSQIKVPKASKAKASWISSAGAVPISEEEYTFVTIEAKKSGIRPAISKDMIDDAEWDVVERQLAEAARAMAEFETEQIITTMISDAGNTATAETSGTLSFNDIANMWGTMASKDREPDVLAVNPAEFADLLKDSAIQNIVTYRQDEFVPGGTIAYLPGIKVLVSSKVQAGVALLVDSRNAGVLFIRKDITVEEYNDPINDLYHIVCTARWNYATIDSDAIGKITSA